MRPPVGGTGGLMPENNKGDVRNGSLVPGVALFAANLRSLASNGAKFGSLVPCLGQIAKFGTRKLARTNFRPGVSSESRYQTAVFGRIWGTKPLILEEGRCHIADLVRERWIPVHRAVGLWLWSPCRRRQMDRRGRRAALPRGRVRCGSALCGAVGDRRARRDLQGGVARLRRLRVLAWAYLLHRRCRKAAAEDRSQTFENVNE